jgi:hypothetical protein
MSIFDTYIGMGRDYLPQYPIRYQCGLKSGHTINDHCHEDEAINMRSHFDHQDTRKLADTYVLRGLTDYAIRSNQISYWMELGAEVLLTPMSNLKSISIGVDGNHSIDIMVSMLVYRSLMDLFVPRDHKVVERFKQVRPIGSAIRFRLHSNDKDEAETIKWEWNESISIFGYVQDGEYHRKALAQFSKVDFVFLAQNGGQQWY